MIRSDNSTNRNKWKATMNGLIHRVRERDNESKRD